MTDKAESGNRKAEIGDPRPESSEAVAEFVTKQELARRLKKTIRTVENWQRRGYIPFIKAGHSVLFNWDDVVAHLQRHFRVCRMP